MRVKNFIYFASLLFLLVACSKSNEQKAANLAEISIKEKLYIPESYDPVSLKLDSAFAPYDDIEYRQTIMEMMELGIAIQNAQSDLLNAKRDMALFGDMDSEYMQIEYSQEKENYDKIQNRIAELTESAISLKDKYLNLRNSKPTFIGFKAVHVYRAKNNSGNVLMGKAELLYDKELTKVENLIDMDSEEYKMFIEGESQFANKIE